MSVNSFGRIFTVTTWGESHGPALGATVDGCPPGIPLNEAAIQPFLDRRRPGQSKMTTQRQEPDSVRILSGVFEGRTTGTPIQLTIENTDQRSRDYGEIAHAFRPGHADITYHLKYGHRDYRGGGRSSARETAARVAAGGVARAVLRELAQHLTITGYMVQMGDLTVDRARLDLNEIDRNDFFLPDPAAVPEWTDYLSRIRKEQDSVGAVVEVLIQGCPPGLGAPVYGKLDTDLAAAMMSINAVKAVEIGEGMGAARLKGTENADEIRMGPNGPEFLSNHAGGILGGISTGQDIVLRFAVKPTSSILTPRRTINRAGEEIELVTKGRHDPCVGIRAVPVAEAMAACVILDHLLLDRAQTGSKRGVIG
ncbi:MULTISPECIES: chorismate synthase [unclassified Paracoccus (in: a-proteobacteria)]|uniref:chorismate synthase n=1 Tax=unclassified Paracoccus (in: a-proteobacteria) TaxID=2688777 RepID=UPI00160062B2|nr:MULTISPECIES: chorismate synthase [unclassified Paracoccus (in: a-proteobacteria)]MBB1490331.1 chorismate synthase [Paracoccus sp. MC1854]MBB1497173.1 chorismate synthase [Paracoccus sp. MC1862]QQO44848.1 chorismate synthase [Paracoccus sp. MC1862]